MHPITEEENRLFGDWPSRDESFVQDGVVDAEEYCRSRLKLLFILKEVNDPGGGGWDLREFLRGDSIGPTWNTVTRWVEGIYGLPGIVPWCKLRGGDEDRRKHALRKIAVVNLKKRPGAGSADYNELREAVQHDRSFISAQLSLYKPRYVVCCGSIVSDLLFEAEPVGVLSPHDEVWKSTSRGVRYSIVKGTPYIAYLHPQARMPGPLVHYGLVDAVAELAEVD